MTDLPHDDVSLDHALRFDPLDTAEKLTGKSYKQDQSVGHLGLAISLIHNEQKQQMLAAAKDSHYGTTLAEYLAIVAEEGFIKVLETPFEVDGNRKEIQFHFYHPKDGMLLVFNTYLGNTINSGNLYYNWIPDTLPGMVTDYDRMDPKTYTFPFKKEGRIWVNGAHEATSSGGVHGYDKDGRPIFSGYHDCREALRFHIRQLRSFGEFVKPWKDRPFLWLFGYDMEREARKRYGDKMYSETSAFFDRMNRKWFRKMPRWVRKNLGPTPK